MTNSVNPNENEFIDAVEDARIHFLSSEILEHLSSRMKILSGKDCLAIQEEYLEWLAMITSEDIEVDFIEYYAN